MDVSGNMDGNILFNVDGEVDSERVINEGNDSFSSRFEEDSKNSNYSVFYTLD